MAGKALWPGPAVTDGLSRANDGRLLLDLWRQPTRGPDLGRLTWQGYALLRERRWSEAEAHFESMLAQYPDNMTFRAPLIHIIEQSRGPAAAFDYYRQHQSQFENTTGEVNTSWAYAWGNTAWVALHEFTPENVSLADRLSALALASDPASPPVRATRGAVLLAMDRREEGRKMLLAGLRDLDDPPFKIDLCRYLAKDAEAHGHAEEFQAFRALADHLQTTSPHLR
jgi:predicted Zn-dependent protease